MKSRLLTNEKIEVSYAADAGVLVLTAAGVELPWRIDVDERSTWVQVRVGADIVRQTVKLTALTEQRLSSTRIQWVGEIAGSGVALELELAGDALIFSVAPTCTGPNTLIAASWPGAVSSEGRAREAVWMSGNFGQGSLFRADGQAWETSIAWENNPMRLAGMTCDGASLAVIIETPYDARSRMADDGKRTMSHQVEFNPALGELAYTRRLRLVPTAEPGYIAIAQTFRDYARRHGMWRSWDERVAATPEAALLKGAVFCFTGYLHDEDADIVGAMKRMHAYGFERGYVYSPKLRTFDDAHWGKVIGNFNSLSDAQIQEIQALGYLCAPFLQIEEATAAIGEGLLARDANGQPIRRWQIGDTHFSEIVKWRVPGMMPRLDADMACAQAIHFDTLTAMPLVEHWGQGSYDRAGDVRLRREIASYYRRHGKVICSESLCDWANDVCDIGTSRHFVPRFGPRTGCTGGADRVWTVPLTDLVYHDSCIRIGWEHWYYNDSSTVYDYDQMTWHPFAMPLMDLLTASPPVLFPEGKMYCYELEQVTAADGRVSNRLHWDRPRVYRNRFSDPALQEALPAALRVCRLNARHGTARMLSHRYVDTGSPLIQETTFDSGLRVVANFSDEPFILEGKTVPARSALTEE